MRIRIAALLAALGGLALLGSVSMGGGEAQAAICVPVGSATDCNFIVTLNPDNTVTGALGPSRATYDGIDEALVGVINRGTVPITALRLRAAGNGGGLFAFDGDGVCNGSYYPATICGPGPHPTGYEGPNTQFANIARTFVTADTGDVVFTTPLAPGGFAFFSLESDPRMVPGGIVVGVPEPTGLASLGVGLVGAALARRRRPRATRARVRTA